MQIYFKYDKTQVSPGVLTTGVRADPWIFKEQPHCPEAEIMPQGGSQWTMLSIESKEKFMGIWEHCING